MTASAGLNYENSKISQTNRIHQRNVSFSTWLLKIFKQVWNRFFSWNVTYVRYIFYLFGHESCNNRIKDACRVTKWNYARKCRSKTPSSLSGVAESISGNVSNKLSDVHCKITKQQECVACYYKYKLLLQFWANFTRDEHKTRNY